jgi:tripartite-type tricarboxylate transporter receptor subunit TctC
MRFRIVSLLFLLFVSTGQSALAAESTGAPDFPTRPIRFIIGFLPGGVSDTIARIVGAKLSEQMKQNIVIDGRPGAGGALAMGIVVDASPDGYTWYLAQPVVTLSRLSKNRPPYDPVEALAPVSLLGNGPTAMVVHPSLPVTTVADVIKYAKSQPKGVLIGSSGIGSTNHMAGELFKSMAKVPFVHVPYKGAAANALALMRGEIQIAFQPLAAAIPHMKSGRLKGIAVSGTKRARAMPDLPTIAETLPGFMVSAWYGIMVPAKTPRPVVNLLSRQVQKAVESPDVSAALLRSGVEAEGNTPDEFAKLIREDATRWEKLVRDAKIDL